MRDGVALAQAGHSVRLREGARDDHLRVLDGERHVRLVIRIGHVVEVRLVDEDRRVGRRGDQLREEVAGRPRADVRRRRVVRVAVEHEPRAFRRVEHHVQIDLELRIELHADDLVANQFGVAGALFVGRNRADQRFGLGREDLRGGAEDFGGSFAEEHVLGLHLEVAGDRVREVAHLTRVAARLLAALEQRAQRVEHSLPRSDRVLVARDADDAALDGLQIRFDGRPDGVLAAPAPDLAREGRAGANPDSLNEVTS